MTGVHTSPHLPPTDDAAGAPAWADAQIERSIVDVLHSTGQIDAAYVSVTVHHRAVTLRGLTRCWSERQLVERIAWAAPFVKSVHNELEVGSLTLRGTR
jgi:osmotically-inducible protein OsmY